MKLLFVKSNCAKFVYLKSQQPEKFKYFDKKPFIAVKVYFLNSAFLTPSTTKSYEHLQSQSLADEKCDMLKNVSHQNHGKYSTK